MSEKTPYERLSKRLLPTDVYLAIKISRTPGSGARIIEWKDTECAGLTLRITKTGAAWLIRKRDRTDRQNKKRYSKDMLQSSHVYPPTDYVLIV